MRWTRKGEPESDDEWYYCVRHGKVETAGECPAKDRLGPYPTREDAEQALERVRERNEEWRRQDEASSS